MFTKGTVDDLLKKNQLEQQKKKKKEAKKTKASSSSAPAATDQEKIYGMTPGGSDSDDDTGAQDAQDRATEGPLGARKIGDYSPYHQPTNSLVYSQVTMQPTGSDSRWRGQLGLSPGTQETGYNPTPNPRQGRYFCPGCDMRFHLSESMAEHLDGCHGIGLEPNYLNEYSVGELVSGINNLAIGKKFRFDVAEIKPKFQMIKPVAKIPWMGHQIFKKDGEPMSLDATIDDHLIDNYRKVPS
eukprot:552234-Amphidinium_carterae.1